MGGRVRGTGIEGPGAVRILYVGSDADRANQAAERLEEENGRFDVVTTTGIATGSDRLREERVDCVVAEYDLPERDGLAFLDAVREEYPDLPFVLFTGQGTESVASRAFGKGATDYVRKQSEEQFARLAESVGEAVEEYDTRRRRKRRASVFEATPVAVVVGERRGDSYPVVDANAAFEDIFGVDAERLVGRDVFEALDLSQTERETFEEALEAGWTVRVETDRETVSGTRQFLLDVMATGRDGRPATWAAGYIDISAQKERERSFERQATALSEFRRLIDTVPDGVFKMDADGRMRDVNEGWAAIVGKEPQEIEGEPLASLVEEGVVPERIVEEYESIVEELLASEDPESQRLTAEVVPPDDTEPHVYEAHVGLLPHEESFQGCAVVVRDVTEREHRKRELERLREQTEFALETTDSVIHVVDPEASKLEVYAGPVESVFGVAPGDADTPPEFFADAVHPEDNEAVKRGWEELTEGESDHVTVQFRTDPDDGERRWVESEARRRTDGDRRGRIVGLSTDITEQKRREQRLQRQNERLDDFASIVSHDLRNPLNVASGRLELARDECDSEHLDAVEQAHDRMQRLVEDLLTLAREGDAATETTAVDLTAVAERCWHTVQTHDATLVTSGECTIRADPTRLQELLENLIGNAVEHGSTSPDSQARQDAVEHGSTSPASDGRQDAVEHGGEGVTVTVGPLEEEDGFYVADDGPGIPAEEREQVFESGYSTAEEGTGFGLAIVREIASAHGWTISVTESEDGGARFEITGVETE